MKKTKSRTRKSIWKNISKEKGYENEQ